MDKQNYYQTITQISAADFKDRGSKFLAYAFPMQTIQHFKEQMSFLKKEHTKAVHHCFAYRIGMDGNNFRSSDDGEPSGTAGKPILNQIDSKEITNAGIIVVRYWGGTLLGVPGLINAYKTSASLALQTTPIVQKAIEVIYYVEFDYMQLNDVMTILKQHQCTTINQQLQLFCSITCGIPKINLELVIHKLSDISNLQLKKI